MLKKIFDMDNPVMQALNTAAYLMILNILTIVLSIPLITAGAAFTALHDVMRSIVRREETYPARMYIDSFKKNLKPGIPLGIIFILAAAVTVLDYFAAAAFIPPFRFIAFAIGIMILALSFYAFALFARFENTITGTLKNAFLLMIVYFPKTAGMTAFTVIVYLAAIRFPTISAPLMLMFGISMPVYISAILLIDVLEKMEEGN